MAEYDDEVKDLKRFDEIIAGLPEEDREVVERGLKRRRAATARAAISQVMARNFSHNVGRHIGGISD